MVALQSSARLLVRSRQIYSISQYRSSCHCVRGCRRTACLHLLRRSVSSSTILSNASSITANRLSGSPIAASPAAAHSTHLKSRINSSIGAFVIGVGVHVGPAAATFDIGINPASDATITKEEDWNTPYTLRSEPMQDVSVRKSTSRP